MERGKVKNELCGVELELKVLSWNHGFEICKETDVHKHTHLYLCFTALSTETWKQWHPTHNEYIC